MDSGRSAGSELSVNEVLRRIKEKSEREKKAQDDKEIDLMGPYNAFSRPKSSSVVPLRTELLDPEVNNFPRSRTRTELLKRIRAAYMPHPSYDLDADGYVSTDDYKMAKRCDLDGNGVLDSDEREIGKRVLAEEFFKRHEKDKHNFGAQIAARTHKENVEKLVTSYSFERAYGKLMQVERTLNAESSKPMIACMSDVDDPLFNATKYYCDKFDTSGKLLTLSCVYLTHLVSYVCCCVVLSMERHEPDPSFFSGAEHGQHAAVLALPDGPGIFVGAVLQHG